MFLNLQQTLYIEIYLLANIYQTANVAIKLGEIILEIRMMDMNIFANHANLYHNSNN